MAWQDFIYPRSMFGSNQQQQTGPDIRNLPEIQKILKRLEEGDTNPVYEFGSSILRTIGGGGAAVGAYRSSKAEMSQLEANRMSANLAAIEKSKILRDQAERNRKANVAKAAALGILEESGRSGTSQAALQSLSNRRVAQDLRGIESGLNIRHMSLDAQARAIRAKRDQDILAGAFTAGMGLLKGYKAYDPRAKKLLSLFRST